MPARKYRSPAHGLMSPSRPPRPRSCDRAGCARVRRSREFEEQFAKTVGARHAIAVSNGSIALLVCLQAMGIEPGDEVIAPNMTFISSATAAMVLGTKPVLCDINLTNYCIDVDRLASLITPRTKAIVPVHYAGQTADMGPILDLANKHGLQILEDAAEAQLGSL